MQLVGGLNKANAAPETVKATFVKIENGKIFVSVTVEDYNAIFANNVNGGMLEKFKMIALQVPLSDKVTETVAVFICAFTEITLLINRSFLLPTTSSLYKILLAETNATGSLIEN